MDNSQMKANRFGRWALARRIPAELIGLSVVVAFVYTVLRVLDALNVHLANVPWWPW